MFPLMFVLSILFWVVLLGGGSYVAFRFVRAFERRGGERQELQELRQQLLRLEEAMDAMGRDVDRLTEEQQFTMKLLTERSDTPGP